MNLKVVVLECDLCSEIGGDLDHEGLNRVVGKRDWREKVIILEGQQPKADPIIGTCLSRPGQSRGNVQIGTRAYQLHY